MSLISNIQNSLSSLSRSRKILLACILIGVIILYWWPSVIPLRSTRIKIEPEDLCLGAYEQTHHKDIQAFDVIVNHAEPQDIEEYKFYPFVGNGHVGLSVLPNEPIYIKHGRALSVSIPFFPVVTSSLVGFPSKDLTSLHIREGLVEQVQCHATGETCVSVVKRTLVHRNRPSIFLQIIYVSNPTEKTATISLEQIALSDWHDAKTVTKSTTDSRQQQVSYIVSTGTVAAPAPEGSPDPQKVYVVSVASTKVTDAITVKSGGKQNYEVMTAVKYSEQPVEASDVDNNMPLIADLAEKSLVQALNINPKILVQEHSDVWRKHWTSGFGMSYSRAPSAINGDHINTTIYYAMSHMPAPIHEAGTPATQKFELEKLLYFPDRCYEGHHTLQNERLWERVSSTEGLIELVTLWLITMEKHGCTSMLQAGSDGLLQAMLLSFGALRFSNDHLEFGTEPRDLHRDYFFRRINYGNNTHVNVSVIVGDDNKAMLYVSLDRNDREFYACDAGCLDSPVKLSRELVAFPVKQTSPLTAIMYITSDKGHMEELKHAIHVKEIAIAPAHEHHVIALHKHGHHLGGLPVMFWVSIGLLIAVFHLFLFKLIFNEYCQSSLDRYTRTTKYNI